jgi:CubicO group peptidase (beta-lactamase class C family)
LWAYGTKVSEVLENGPRISVNQLLTHSSGLTTDSTQVSMRSQLDNPDRKTDLKAIFERGAEGPAGGFVYNNENYAILGAMIEAETSQSYQKTCSKRALAPAGVRAKLSKRAGAFDAFGGWAMSSADYAKFFHFHFGPSTDAAKSALNLPKIKAGNAVYYGPGVTFRQWGEGANFWHFGVLCFPRRLNVGSFAVQFDIGWTLVATYDGCVDWPAMGQLDRVMADAIFERQ